MAFFLNPRDQEKTTYRVAVKRLLRLSLLLKTFIFIILDIVFNNKIYTALHMVILLGLYGLIPFLIRVYMMITHGIVNGFEGGTEYIKIFSPPLTVQWRGGENPHIPAASQSLNSTRGINEAIAPSPSTATRGAEERTDKIWNVNRNNLFKITPSNKLTIKNNSFNNFPQGNNNQNEFGFLTEDDRRREDKYPAGRKIY